MENLKERHIALIGMSNVGKSHWARQLTTSGYVLIDCDRNVEGRLAKKIGKKDLGGIGGVAEWMGQPYDPQYKERSTAYLQEEAEVMHEAADLLRTGRHNYVVDTTGSVIYLAREIQEALQQASTVVYLKAPDSVTDDMVRKFTECPKPLIWGNIYTPKNGKSDKESLIDCYPKLLEDRAKRYEAIADITLDNYQALREKGVTVYQFMDHVEERSRPLYKA